ncbi:MAG: D-amino acid dehydrogenase [Minwuia sp.]|nr:D-amino acid dehydrogenase [Minwuia sp.]
MRIVVLGAGVIGVTTAHALAVRGHDVVVIEAESGPALGTSFANGAQISPSEAVPWASPAALRLAMGWMRSGNAPFRLNLRAEPHQWAWLTEFVRNCTDARWQRNAPAMVALATHSRHCLLELNDRYDIDYAREQCGILRIFQRMEQAHAEQAHIGGVMAAHDVPLEILDADACVALEPALADAVAAGRVGAGLLAPEDETGDAQAFSVGLAREAVAAGVTFRFGEQVRRINAFCDHVTGVVTDTREVRADRVVVALGTASVDLMRSIGVSLPIYPVKGYSATLPVRGSNSAPRVSITDQSGRFVVSRLGDRVRVAGKADIIGHGRDIDPARAANVLDNLFGLFPNVGNRHDATVWSGLRPMTPSGIPLIGESDMQGLYLNTGHGSLGWTMAAGSADLLADLISGTRPRIDPAPYAP